MNGCKNKSMENCQTREHGCHNQFVLVRCININFRKASKKYDEESEREKMAQNKMMI